MTRFLVQCLLLLAAIQGSAFASETRTVLGSAPIPAKMGVGPERYAAMLERARGEGSQACILDEACAGVTATWLKDLQAKLGTENTGLFEKLIAVQDYFSVDKYRRDRDAPMWTYIPEEEGKDEWKHVAAFLKDRGGDCEDFAIIKAAALHALGMEDLKVVVLRDDAVAESHAVLAVITRNATYILDSKLNTVVHDDSLFVRAYSPLFYMDYDPDADSDHISGGLFGLRKSHSLIPVSK